MKRMMTIALAFTLMLVGCSSQNSDQETTKTEPSKETIVLGMTEWTSTKAPSAIMKALLESKGYQVEYKKAEQPVLFLGLKKQDIDFFMDAWLPYTEAPLWEKYQDDLVQVATSYENAPLGWVVPSYLEVNSISDLNGKADLFNGKIVGLSEGSGMTETSREMIKDYGLNFEYVASGEAAMMTEAKRKIDKKEPIIFLGWRPHSMFQKFDLKFLEDPKENFKTDNVYVISYKGIEEKHSEVYDIMSRWSIEVEELEAMMLENEENGTTFEELAEKWIAEHPEKVNELLGQ